MGSAIVTGNLGLVGSYVAEALAAANFNVYGIDNDVRSKLFSDILPLQQDEINKMNSDSGITRFFNVDIRDCEGMRSAIGDVLSRDNLDVVVHCAAQPSHDWAANDPLVDLNINLTATVNLLEILREKNFNGVFIFLSTNKVYGDTPNFLDLEKREYRYELPTNNPFYSGIDTSMSIDNSLHSLFGCSKASADLYVQEYARYFGLKTVILRGGCLTGSRHRGAKLHGFLSYLVKTAVAGDHYTIIGYDGYQVRDNLHAADIGKLVCKIADSSKVMSSDQFPIVSNMGGGRSNSVSVLEAVNILKNSFDLRFNYSTSNNARRGDHKWYISDNSLLLKQFDWAPTTSLEEILSDMVST